LRVLRDMMQVSHGVMGDAEMGRRRASFEALARKGCHAGPSPFAAVGRTSGGARKKC
jgi:hypothetical protein